MPNNLEAARKVLEENSEVLYGIFGVVRGSGYFPPREFLNQFLGAGHDPCDQDGRMTNWRPVSVTAGEYAELKAWWIMKNPGSIESPLEASDWNEWVSCVLGNRDDA